MALTEIAGLAELSAAFDETRKKINGALITAVEQTAEAMGDRARTMVPIGTDAQSGDLLDSIEVETHGLFGSVSAGNPETDYALYVEYGAGPSNPVAQPFMRPAADLGQQELPTRIANEVRNRFGS